MPFGKPLDLAGDFIANFVLRRGDRNEIETLVREVLDGPEAFVEEPLRGKFARALLKSRPKIRGTLVPYQKWGEDIDPQSIEQMEIACRLPVAVQGALMPDAHLGYGLPIGGVLATENAVVPYAVGVDIACRMKMTVLDIRFEALQRRQDWLRKAIEEETRFGIGASFRKNRRQHAVLDADWSVSDITKKDKDKAWAQLGTSGSGNHFVEFGSFESDETIGGLEPGSYVALLSHSGSRGVGAAVCSHYSRIAKQRCSDLARELSNLAWLDLDSAEGQEYWRAMSLMGEYAAANHACIHEHIAEHLGAEKLLSVENHHNFAWEEEHVIDGVKKNLIVHRKGATPADSGVLGIIPGSMAAPGFLVRGKGNQASLKSASHGAGRIMSRKQALKSFRWQEAKALLKDRGVTLMSAGLDEMPMVYKDIHDVMKAQEDLVEVIGRFDPKLVKMAPAGERPED